MPSQILIANINKVQRSASFRWRGAALDPAKPPFGFNLGSHGRPKFGEAGGVDDEIDSHLYPSPLEKTSQNTRSPRHANA
jgi:hypothetical protein